MAFLRQASFRRTKSSAEIARAEEHEVRSRKVSGASDMQSDGETKGKHKLHLGKGKKRLSSLFTSSHTLSGQSTEKGSPLRPDVSRTSSGASIPIGDNGLGGSNKYSALNGRGAPPESKFVEEGVQHPQVGSSVIPMTGSPDGSPVAETAPGPPVQPVSAAGTTPNAPTPSHSQGPSTLYSQWDEEGGSESGEEDEIYGTPSEGLSEVEEVDETRAVPPTAPAASRPDDVSQVESQAIQAAAVAPMSLDMPQVDPAVPQVDPALDVSNVPKGTIIGDGDVAGTGKSTVHRSLPVSSETRVRQRVASKAGVTNIDQASVLAQDIDTCREALTLFMTSQMREAEDLLYDRDADGNRLYLQSASMIIQALKGLMTFDSQDLLTALEICRGTFTTASALRRPGDSLVSKLGGFIRSGQGVARVKAMTVLERHAELVYAETSLMKAILSIVSGGDWFGMIREAFNMRSAHGIYQTLQQFLDQADKNGFDEDIDMDFRSGVLLGTGTSSLMLSLLPGKVMKLAEVFGYAGDRKVALDTLMSAGGWTADSDKPAYNERNEGVRRPVCDLILLSFHLVISVLMPVDGIDIPLARKILAYNLRRYPDGVFFLYFQARLHENQCEPDLANQQLQRALNLRLEYVQLQHMCLWDYSCNYLLLENWKGALDCFTILKEESNWSRATYTYAAAACIVELVEDGQELAKIEEADKLMKQIPSLTRKIAGKSLPIEKLCSRKSRKFDSQGKRLFLPALELAYVFGIVSLTPRRSLLDNHLPRINRMLKRLSEQTPEEYNGGGGGFWDDYCLGHFLRAVVQFVARYPVPNATAEAIRTRPGDPSDAELDQGAEADFRAVLKRGPDVQLDHYIIYHCHYELGRYYARKGDAAQARQHFDVVMSGKLLEANPHEKKGQGKYSLEGALQLRTHAALSSLNEHGKRL